MAEREYIERNELIKNLNTFAPEHYNALINDLIIKQPVADVESVKYGHWICIGDIDEYIFECSECHEIYYLNDGTPKEHQYNYCPNCGAKLCKGEENNA